MAAVAAAQNVMLAQKWSEKIDPTGYWMSEKLDGVRAYWSGSKFFSRQGNEFIAPKFFTKDLPKEPLDGELWCGRGLFQKTISIIKKTKDPEKYADDWKYVTYLVFDAPGRSAAGDRYEQRVKWLEENIEPKKETTFAAVVGVCKCTGMPHLQKMLKQVLMKGGEGIMLRQPNSLYETCRSHTLLKVKHFHDEEAKVTGHENGSGRLASLMGKIHCVLPNGLAFKIGSGFTDAQRRNPPKIGSVVSFKYQELSDHGHPRFPTFLRERPDLTWNDVMTAAKAKAPFSSLKKKALVPQLKKMHSILFSTVPSRDQETGKKVVTQDDADEDAEEEADNILTKKALAITLPPAAAAAGTTGAAAAAAGGKKRHAVGPSGKRMCQWGASCYQTNPAHLAAFEHPKKEDEDAPPSDGLVNDELDKIVDPDYEEERPRKKAKVTTPTDAAAASSPSTRAVAAAAASSSSPSPPSSPVPAAAPATKRACYYGADCYNKDPSHLSRFTHPDPKPAPRTVEEFIQTTNQSQHDLAEYYQFGGDEEEDEVEAILAEDRNERKLSLQRFSDQAIAEGLIDADMLGDGAVAPFAGTTRDEDDEVRTVIFDTKPRAPVSRDYFEACASDDEEEDSKTVLVADLPRPVKSGGATKVTPRVSSTASTQLVQAATTRQQVTTTPTPTPAVAAATVTATAASATVSSSTNGSTKKCVYIVPELLSKSILTVEDDEGIRCKRCGQDVGEHRESR